MQWEEVRRSEGDALSLFALEVLWVLSRLPGILGWVDALLAAELVMIMHSVEGFCLQLKTYALGLGSFLPTIIVAVPCCDQVTVASLALVAAAAAAARVLAANCGQAVEEYEVDIAEGAQGSHVITPEM